MSFQNFGTQAGVVNLLQRCLERGRLAHAYLFAGNELGQLETMATTLAKTLNCENPPRRAPTGIALDSCDQCAACRKIEEQAHPDILWVRPESKSRVITIDQMREVMQTIFLKPTAAPWKVAILVCADRLNIHAANSFLKTLEEPPPNSIVILISTDPQRVLETIVSRCLRLNFAGAEAHPDSPELIGWLQRFSAMAALKQTSLLGRYQLLSVLLKRLNEIKLSVSDTLSKRSPLERYDDLDSRTRERFEDELAAATEAEYRRQRTDLLAGLHWWLRDIWLHTLGAAEGQLSYPVLAPDAQTVAKRLSTDEAVVNLTIIEQMQRLLASNVQEALTLEVGLLRLKL